VAEFAYITLQGHEAELAGWWIPNRAEEVSSAENTAHGRLNNMEYDSIVITSYLKRESLHRALLDHGIADKEHPGESSRSGDKDHASH